MKTRVDLEERGGWGIPNINCSKYPVSHTRSFFENLFRCIRCPLSFVTFGSLFECQGKSTEVIRNVEFVRYTRTRFR